MTFSTFATTVASMMIVSLAVDSTSGAQQWKQVRDILDGALALPPPAERLESVRNFARGNSAIVAARWTWVPRRASGALCCRGGR